MKKWLILLIVAASLAFIYYLVITYVEYTPQWLLGEKTTVRRGSIRSPISASGRIEPAMRIDIKSEASGPVTDILVRNGDYARKGDTLIVLDPNEEKLSTEKAELAVAEAEKSMKIAAAQALKAKVSGIEHARASTQSAEARTKQTQSSLEILQNARKARAATTHELTLAESGNVEALANLDAARAGLKAAELDAQIAAEQVDSARNNYETTKRNLSDSQRRLSQTIIKAPSDGMVAKVMVQIGALVQSGTRSLTGGTPLISLADTSKLYVIAMVDDADFGLVRKIAPPSARPKMKPTTQASSQPASVVPSATSASTQASGGKAAKSSKDPALPEPPIDATQKVKVMVDTFPDEEFWGVIERIDPEGESHGAIVQYKVHVLLTSKNAYDMLQLGLPATVEFTAESRENVLTVESRCIKKEADEYGVYIPDPKPQDKLATRFIRVRTGISDGTYTEILEGSELKEGMEIYRIPPAPSRERGKE